MSSPKKRKKGGEGAPAPVLETPTVIPDIPVPSRNPLEADQAPLLKSDDEVSTSDDDENEWVNVGRILKRIPRDNPNDPYKQNSTEIIHHLAQQGRPPRNLLPHEEQLLQNYGAHFDLCTPFDRSDPGGPDLSRIPPNCRVEIRKLPPWLASFVQNQFETFLNRYKGNTYVFLQQLASHVQYRKATYGASRNPTRDDPVGRLRMAEEHADETELLFHSEEFRKAQFSRGMSTKPVQKQGTSTTEIGGDNISNPMSPGDKPRAGVPPEDNLSNPGLPGDTPVPRNSSSDEAEPPMMVLDISEEDQPEEYWSPVLILRAADTLRAVLVAGASESEDEDYIEEDDDDALVTKIRDKRRALVRHKDEEFVYKGLHWEDIVAERGHFKEQARFEVEMEFCPKAKRKDLYWATCLPKPKEWKNPRRCCNFMKFFRRGTRDKTKRDQRRKQKRESKGEDDLGSRRKRDYYSYYPGHPLYREPEGRVQRKARLFRERGVGKRPSRIYNKDLCKGPITRVTRHLHQPRTLEGFHAYVNWIVASVTFRYLIMGVIILNAILLAAETGTRKERYAKLFDFVDSIFLSVYIVEFMMKVYANPIQYFHSGFNLFDFLILLASMVKAGLEWIRGTDYSWLSLMIIIRAFRILRGVSLSIHIQVLVTALVETLKNHVLSVVVLLLLLMYIASIMAFYFFSDKAGLHNTWINVPAGMLRMFSFVTMDGWTEILDQFEDANMLNEGRLFCFICIVLGNFVFSNIFIAIIIMQISEATDSFRKAQTEERESSVYLKQESVFKRQQLDMRHLLARRKMGVSEDFYELGSKFVRRLRHDDLCDSRGVVFSPLWMDALYKGMQRADHTSSILMNLHRKMSDRLVKLNNLYDEGKYAVRGISRARYNRWYDTKAKLTLLKEYFLDLRKVPPAGNLRIRLPKDDLKVKTRDHAGPPSKSKEIKPTTKSKDRLKQAEQKGRKGPPSTTSAPKLPIDNDITSI